MMLAIDWTQLAQVVLAGVLVGLVAKLFGLISRGTKAGFKAEIQQEVHAVLDRKDQADARTADNDRVSLRRELDQIWSAINNLRNRGRS